MKKDKKKSRYTSIFLPVTQIENIRVMGEKEDRNFSSMLRMIIKRWETREKLIK